MVASHELDSTVDYCSHGNNAMVNIHVTNLTAIAGGLLFFM